MKTYSAHLKYVHKDGYIIEGDGYVTEDNEDYVGIVKDLHDGMYSSYIWDGEDVLTRCPDGMTASVVAVIPVIVTVTDMKGLPYVLDPVSVLTYTREGQTEVLDRYLKDGKEEEE